MTKPMAPVFSDQPLSATLLAELAQLGVNVAELARSPDVVDELAELASPEEERLVRVWERTKIALTACGRAIYGSTQIGATTELVEFARAVRECLTVELGAKVEVDHLNRTVNIRLGQIEQVTRSRSKMTGGL